MVHLRINQYCIREWLGACLVPGHCLNQWWSNSLMYLCVTWPQWVMWISLTVCSNNYVHDPQLIVFCPGQAMIQLPWCISWWFHWHWGNHIMADSRFCAQPMRDGVTLYRHLSLAGHKPRISPAYEAIISGLILGFHPAYERWRYFVTMSLIGWAQA